MIGAAFATYQNPMRVCDSADFDGTNDHMSRSGLSGAVDSKKGLFSCWLRLDGGDGTDMEIMSGFESADGLLYFTMRRQSSNRISVVLGGSLQVTFATLSPSTFQASATWRHILCSWDCATPLARHLYVNDVNEVGTPSVFTDGTIDYTLSSWAVGSSANAPSLRLNGCLAEVYLAPGEYLDLSLVANRRKFISASGKPVHLGATGSLPTGTAPLIYLHLDDAESAASFATNRGTGGDFSITGSLSTGSSSPSD
jgi:hypothetical protein